MSLNRRTKLIGTNAAVGFAVGYGFSKFILKSERKIAANHGLILAALGVAYGYLRTPSIEVKSNASGDVPSPKANTKTPNSWWMDRGGNWHWVNSRGKITN